MRELSTRTAYYSEVETARSVVSSSQPCDSVRRRRRRAGMEGAEPRNVVDPQSTVTAAELGAELTARSPDSLRAELDTVRSGAPDEASSKLEGPAQPPLSLSDRLYLWFCWAGTAVRTAAQLCVIFYRFLCLLYQYPNASGVAINMTYKSLKILYKNGLWQPFGPPKSAAAQASSDSANKDKPPGAPAASDKQQIAQKAR